MMTFAKILLGVDNIRNKQKETKEREKKQVTSIKTVSKKKNIVYQ